MHPRSIWYGNDISTLYQAEVIRRISIQRIRTPGNGYHFPQYDPMRLQGLASCWLDGIQIDRMTLSTINWRATEMSYSSGHQLNHLEQDYQHPSGRDTTPHIVMITTMREMACGGSEKGWQVEFCERKEFHLDENSPINRPISTCLRMLSELLFRLRRSIGTQYYI